MLAAAREECRPTADETQNGVSVAPMGLPFDFIGLTQGGTAFWAACPGLWSDGPFGAFAAPRREVPRRVRAAPAAAAGGFPALPPERGITPERSDRASHGLLH